MAKPPKKPQKNKDPAKPTRAKAARPDSPVTPDALADLLNPAINKGTAGLGPSTGKNPNLAPPPDNSWDRRRDFSDAHTARKSAREGFAEAPQRDYAASPITGLDPRLETELGLAPDDDATSPPPLRGRSRAEGAREWGELTGTDNKGPPPADLRPATSPCKGGGERAAAEWRQFPNTACRAPICPSPAAGWPRWASPPPRSRSTSLLREGRAEFRNEATTGKVWTPHRPPRPEKSEGGRRLTIDSEFEPKGDQPQAIKDLVEGVQRHDRTQVLLGVTGSGKTFTMAKVIEATQRPALILAPNKTLAAQLYGEFKSFFPDNAVEYFVSYYDYYQPEAYVPRTDTYIEKESSINEQIDRMRHSATRALLERDDVVIVASVSCIYGIGSVETYSAMTFTLKQGGAISQRQLIADLVALQYKRSGGDFFRGAFRVRGDVIDIFPAHYEDRAWRVHLFGDKIEKIEEMDPLTGAEDRRAGIRQGLRQFALRHAAPDADPGDARHQGRAARPPRAAQRRRPPAGSAAARAAHHLRPRNDGGDRLLRRHRELFALSHRPQAGRAAADSVRIRARQRAGVRRREPRHHPAARRHVPRRLPPQGDAGRIRLPPALLHGQPAAALRGMGRHAAADRRRLGDAGRRGSSTSRAACSSSR